MAGKPLQEFVEEVGKGSHLRVEHDFGDGYVRLRTSEAERRQAAQDIQSSENILIELLRNSKDAHAAHIFVASTREGDKRFLTVIDDGDGIPEAMHAHVFEPRVTSKLDTSHMDAWGLHGRGMALFSIAQNTAEAGVVASESGLGCSMRTISDTAKLPERKDQSSFPVFELDDNGTVNVRGPKNLIRTACEFAIEARDTCSVFLGSPAEIAATLVMYGMSTLSAVDRLFCKDVSGLPLTKRLATASDPADLASLCEGIGLDISERTARRILDGVIAPQEPLLEQIRIDRKAAAKGKRRSRKAGVSSIKLEKQDVEALQQAISGTFGELAGRYYLNPDVTPAVRVFADRLVVTVPLVNEDE